MASMSPSAQALARIIHEGFYGNCEYAAATSLAAKSKARNSSPHTFEVRGRTKCGLAGGLVPRGLNVLVQVRLGLVGLHAPVSHGVSAVSSRSSMNSAGLLCRESFDCRSLDSHPS